MRFTRIAGVRLWLALSLCTVTRSASAHAPPQVLQIVWLEAGAGVVLVTNRGLVFSDADGTAYRLLCGEAAGLGVYDRPGFTVAGDGRMLVTTNAGLRASADGGCGWQAVAPFDTLQTTALAAAGAAGAPVFVAAYGPGQGGIYRSDDAASRFERALTVEDNDFLRVLRIAPGMPERVYASGSEFDTAGNFTHYIARSSDGGETWERSEVPVLEGELDVTLLAISPSDPDVLLARASGSEPTVVPERLLVSRDAGASFASPLALLELADAAFGADGANVWVAGREGLWRSTDAGATFARVGAAERVSHVVEHDGKLFAAGYYQGVASSANGIGVSTDGGERFASWLELHDVSEPVACDPGAIGSTACATPWLDWEREILRPVAPPDAGAAPADASVPQPDAATTGADASADADASPPPRTKDDGGCSVSGGPAHGTRHNPLTATMLLLSLAVLSLRAPARVRSR